MNLTNQLFELDVRLLYWTELQRQKRTILFAARCFSRSGDGYLQVLCVLLLAIAPLITSTYDTKSIAVWLACLFACERIIYFILKNVLKRKRPPEALPSFTAVIKASDQFSFPSGHTSAAFLLVAVFALQEWAVFWMALPWAVVVGISRVVLGVHYPSDIVAGAALGASVAYVGSSLI